MIMTYLAVLLYPFRLLFTKPKQHVIEKIYEGVSLLEILIWEGVSLLEILIWVHYKGMWIKNLPYMSY
jgi:hypothetical protein